MANEEKGQKKNSKKRVDIEPDPDLENHRYLGEEETDGD